MKCPECQFDNLEEAKFCNECGKKLEIACPKCSKDNPLQGKFCNECGNSLILPSKPALKELSPDEKLEKIRRYLPKDLTEKILSQRDRIEGEHRQVTVMFCDMKEFTPLAEKLGPDETFTLMDQVFEILIHKVNDFQGTVNELRGDGILAFFGAPIALEDAPQRAIRSALAIHREITRFNGKIKGNKDLPPLLLRIGINTGPVVVGTVGNDLRVHFTAMGETINMASRMETLAEAGTTYVTEETFQLTEGFFRFEALGAKHVKGKEQPMNVYRVIAPTTSRTRFDVSAERGLTPIVGRERELELLIDSYERAKAGRGQAISIMSEPGVGKSRLLYEFRKAVSSEDATFLEGKCLSYSRGVAYHPIIDILKSNFDIQEGNEDSDIRKKVKSGLKALGVDEATTLPYLLELLSVKDSGIDKIIMSPEEKRDRIMEALRRIVLKGSEIRTLIMAFEDLHWVDKSSEDVLEYLLESVPEARVLMISTYRPDFTHAWGGKSYHNQVNLNRLSNRQSLTMVSHLLNTESINRDLEELILGKAERVPFFIEEFIKSLIDLRMIERKEGTYCLTEDIQDVTIPSTIQDVIMARVDVLPEVAREVLQAGAGIEREFSHELIRRLVDTPEQDLLSCISILKNSELIYERGLYPQSVYIFKHALTREVIYGSILTGRKKRLHEQIGQAMEKIYPGRIEEHCEQLAHHYDKSGNGEKAVEYLYKAGEKAKQSYANEAAIFYFRRGLELVKTFPETPKRAQQELNYLIALGPPLVFTKGHSAPEVETTYSRARELCEQVGDNSQLFLVLLGLRRFYFGRGELQGAHELGVQLLALARGLKDPNLISRAHFMLAETFLFFGEFEQVREHSEQAISLYDKKRHLSDVFLYGNDTWAGCHIFAANALWYLGYPDQALKRSQVGMSLVRTHSHPSSLTHCLIMAAWLHQLRREDQVVSKRAKEAVTISTEKGFTFFNSWGAVLQGWALAEHSLAAAKGEREVEEGIEQMRHGLAEWKGSGVRMWRPYGLGLLAEVYRNVGKGEKGLSLLAEALKVVEQTGERLHEAELYRLKGELLIIRAKTEYEPETWFGDVENCFQQAIDIARCQGAKSLEIRSVMSLSRFWGEQGKRQEARRLLQEIYSRFSEGFKTADLKEAKMLLDELA